MNEYKPSIQNADSQSASYDRKGASLPNAVGRAAGYLTRAARSASTFIHDSSLVVARLSASRRQLSRGCPVVRHVRSCPVDVRYVSGSVSGSMSDHVRKHVRKGVRKCPMLSDDVRPILDSSTCVTLSGRVRSCPVVSGRVRSCPIMYHGGLWGCPLVYNTTIAPSQRATWRASMSRARWHNAEMQDGVKRFLGFLQCVRNCRWYTSPW